MYKLQAPPLGAIVVRGGGDGGPRVPLVEKVRDFPRFPGIGSGYGRKSGGLIFKNSRTAS